MDQIENKWALTIVLHRRELDGNGGYWSAGVTKDLTRGFKGR